MDFRYSDPDIDISISSSEIRQIVALARKLGEIWDVLSADEHIGSEFEWPAQPLPFKFSVKQSGSVWHDLNITYCGHGLVVCRWGMSDSTTALQADRDD